MSIIKSITPKNCRTKVRRLLAATYKDYIFADENCTQQNSNNFRKFFQSKRVQRESLMLSNIQTSNLTNQLELMALVIFFCDSFSDPNSSNTAPTKCTARGEKIVKILSLPAMIGIPSFLLGIARPFVRCLWR